MFAIPTIGPFEDAPCTLGDRRLSIVRNQRPKVLLAPPTPRVRVRPTGVTDA